MVDLRKIATSKSTTFHLNPSHLKVEEGFNVRKLDAPELAEANTNLKNSIRHNGYDPSKVILVRIEGDDVFIVDGHRRHKVITELNEESPGLIPSVPVFEVPKDATLADRTTLMLTSGLGEQLAPIEKAEAIERLIVEGIPQDDVATRTGYTVKQIQNFLKLAAAPSNVKELVETGVVAATLAVEVLKSEGAVAGADTLAKAVADAKSKGKDKATAKNVAATKPTPAPAPAPAPPPPIAPVVPVIPVAVPLPSAAVPTTPVAAATPPTGVTPDGAPRFAITPPTFNRFRLALWEVLKTDDVKLIHQIVRDAYGINEEQAAALLAPTAAAA